ADGVLALHVLAVHARELLRDEERLRRERLEATRAADDDLVLFAELVLAEDRDDVLEVLVALQDLLDALRGVVLLLAADQRVEDPRRRVERVDRGVETLRRDAAVEDRRGVQVRERRRGRRVGQVVGRDVDRLHRRDRALLRRGDPLLERAHLRRERRLVTD